MERSSNLMARVAVVVSGLVALGLFSWCLFQSLDARDALGIGLAPLLILPAFIHAFSLTWPMLALGVAIRWWRELLRQQDRWEAIGYFVGLPIVVLGLGIWHLRGMLLRLA